MHVEDTGRFNSEIIDKLLKDSKYLPLYKAIGEPVIRSNHKYKLYRDRYYKLDSDTEVDLSEDDLCWLTGNQTDDFVKQAIDKIEKFIKDEKITQLLYELNEE